MTPQEADSLERNYYREQQLAQREGERAQKAQQVLAEREARKQQSADDSFYNKAQREIEHPKKVKPVESPELVQAKEQRKLMTVADHTRKLELEQFDQASAHEVEFDKKTGDVIGGALANRKAELSQAASKKVGLWDGMMSDTLESGQLTPEAQKAQGELDGVTSQIEARRQQRERLKAEHDRTAIAKRDADINYGRQVMGHYGMLPSDIQPDVAQAVVDSATPTAQASTDTAAPKDDSSDILRGFKVALGQTIPITQGLVGLLGDTAERVVGKGGAATAVKNWGVEGYKHGMEKLQPIQRENDNVTVAWDKFKKQGDVGSLVDWAQYGLGYLGGQMGETAALAMIGGLVGSAGTPVGTLAGAGAGVVAKGTVRAAAANLVEKWVAKEAAQIVAEGAAKTGVKLSAEQISKEVAKDSVRRLAAKSIGKTVGSTAAIGANGFTQELGSIYPEAVTEAQAQGKSELSGGDIARVWATGLAAGGLETLSDKLGLDVLTGKVKVPGAGGRLARGAIGAAAGIVGEGGTEVGQTYLERVGAGQSTTDPEAVSDYINSGALGALGGGTIGAVGGASHPIEKKSPGASSQNGQNAPVDPANPTAPITPAAVTPDDGSAPVMDEELAAELGATNQSPAGMEATQAAATEGAPATPAPAINFQDWAKKNKPEAWAELQRRKSAEASGSILAEPSYVLENRLKKSFSDSTSPEAQTTTADRPAADGGKVAPEVPTQLTREAEALIAKVDSGGMPMTVSKGLTRIAKDNGVEVTDQMTPRAVIEAMRAKKTAKPILDGLDKLKKDSERIAKNGKADFWLGVGEDERLDDDVRRASLRLARGKGTAEDQNIVLNALNELPKAINSMAQEGPYQGVTPSSAPAPISKPEIDLTGMGAAIGGNLRERLRGTVEKTGKLDEMEKGTLLEQVYERAVANGHARGVETLDRAIAVVDAAGNEASLAKAEFDKQFSDVPAAQASADKPISAPSQAAQPASPLPAAKPNAGQAVSSPEGNSQQASPLAPSSASPNDGAPAAQSGEVVVPPASQPERIAATAVRDPKTGKITSGNKIHLQLYEEAGIDFMKLDSAGIDAASGFMTNTGRFVTQAEAQKIAEAADQVDGNMPISGEVVRDRISKAKPPSQPPVASSDQPQKSPAKTPAPAPAAGQISTPDEVAQNYTEFAPDMAKQVAAGNAKKLHGYINDDGRELPELLYPNNSVSRKVFTKITGVKLPSSIAESKKTYAEFKSRKSAPAGLTSTESTRPADVAKKTDKADTSPAKPAPYTPKAPLIERGANKPANFAAKLAKAVGLKASDKGAKFLADLSSRLHKAASADFEQMEVHALTQAEWSSHPELSKVTPDSRAAYDAKTNTLYVNTEKSAGRKIIEAVVHEAGHFAERFALSEELVQTEWTKLAITQRIAAWEEYLGRKLSQQEVRDFGHGIDNARARSEWVAFQFARVIKGNAIGMTKQMADRLKKWLDDIRSLVGKWAVGSSAVSSHVLDARILSMMFPKGRRVGFAENPNGMDLLDWIDELGGVPKPPANTAGKGEWDGWKGAFSSGRGRLLQNNVGRTGAIDSFVQELSEISGLRFSSVDAFYAAVPAAWEARDRQNLSTDLQERQAKFYDAALENKGRSATERVGDPVQISTLGEGDTFSVKGEPFTVTGIGDEAPYNVTAKDGDKFGTVELPGDATLYPDAGTFKKAEQSEKTYDDPFATTPAVKPGENLDMFNGGETGGDTTFNLQGETGTDFTGVMDAQAKAKADKAAAEAAQGSLFDAGKPAEDKPAAKPASTAPKISEASKQKLKDKFKDLLGAPAEKLEQASFPKGKAAQLIDVAESLIEDGIKTPAELAAVMDEQLGQSARKFAQAFWDVFGIVDNTLRGTHDWDSIYSAIDKPAADEVKADAPAPVASVKQQMRDIITSDANRSDKARQMKKLADAQGVTLKEMQERIEAELVVMLKEFNSSFPVKTKRQLFDYALDLYSKQPLFSARTSTSIENQAYSTPAPLAAALFNMTEGRFKRLYEPTGGTGMLMFGANLSDSHANELNDTRVKALKDLRVGTVTQENAMTFVPKGKFDVVHANPPFGSIDNVNYDGFGIRKLEHLISLKALEAMDSNGSGALILGANFETGNTSRGAQWVFENYLYSRYHVTGNFEVSGDLYAGQGAKWPVRILVVAGRRAVPLIGELAPKSVDRLDNWNDVWERSQQIRNETESVRKTLGAGQSPGATDRPQAGTSPAANTGGVPPANGRPDRPSNGGGKRAGGGVGKPAISGQSAGGGKAVAPTGNAQKPEVSGSASTQPGITGEQSSPVEGTGAASGNPAANVAGGTEGAGKRNDARKLPADAVAVNAGQITFVPRSGGVPFETLTPREIGRGTHAALDKLADRVGSIDTFVSEKLQMPEDELRTVMSADQIDGVALAIDQIENGGALIIGDETGIGKGRQAAAIMRYAIKNGKVPVFFTLDPKLFSDMYADLGDINTKVRPLIFGDSDRASIVNPKSEEREVLVAAPDSKQQKAIVEKVTENGLSAEGYDAVFATYSQVNSRNHRQLYLERLAKDENVIVILDEAHNAAGQSDGSMQAAFMQGGEITRGKGAMRTITRVPGLLNSTGTQKGRGGVAYLSATYAKRPDNMPLYFRTDMRKATEKFSDLVKAMAKGGVALQQVVSEALASVGQYIRRERDFTGTSYIMKRVEVADLPGLVKQVDGVTDILQQIVKFSKKVKAAVSEMGEGQSTAMSDTQHSVTDFASVVHNQISQLLLAAKADEIVNEAVSAAKRGEKPVITMMNTMESFLSGYIEDNQIKVGQEIELSWKELMKYALSRTMRVTVKQPNGDTQINTLTPAQLGLESQFEAIIEAIGETDIKFPVSPIDYIIQRLRGEGIAVGGIVVGELTGRESGIQYVDFEKGTGTYKRFKKADKNSLVNNFNGGKIDGLLLNASGSTGLSIHASPKFKDTKPRHMIIAQPALDINVFMQTIGRIKRTGMLPGSARYTHLTLPLQAELRPAAVANRKMKSLNANTTAESEGMVKIDSTDIINKYGDHIIAQYLADDYGLQSDLGLDIEVKEDGVAKAEEDLGKKFMGRLALLPDGEQARIYGDIIPAYNDYIEQLRATNEYDLDVAVHDDWDGTLGQETVLKDGTDETSIFTASVRAQKWEITDNRPIPTGEQMRREFEKNTGGKEKLDKDWADFKQTVNSRMMANIAKAEAALAKEQANPSEVGKAVSVMIAQNNVNQARITLEKWERTSLKVSQTIGLAGRAITLEDTSVREVWQGALIGVKFPDISGNSLRVSPSRFQFKYLLDTPGGRMYVSGAQIIEGSMQQGRAIQSIDDFKGQNKSARYQRWVITGNPIAGYRATGGAGKMTRFKARDGSVITGLLMRNNWDPEKLAEDPRFQMVNGKAAANFLVSQPMRGAFWNLTGGDGAEIQITRKWNGGYQIITPSSAKGRDVFLDDQLRGVVGDFTKSGSKMNADLSSDKATIAKVVDRIVSITGRPMQAHGTTTQIRAAVEKANKEASGLLGAPAEAETLSPPKNAPVPGSPGSRYRSHTDTLIERGIAAARLEYRTLSDVDAVAAAKAFIAQSGEAAAAEAVFDDTLDVPAKVRTAIGAMIEIQLDARSHDASLSAEERRTAARQFARLSERMAYRGTSLGQAVQGYNLVNRLSPAGVIQSAQEAAKTRQDKAIGPEGEKALKEIKEAMDKANAEKIDEATEAMNEAFRALRIGKSIWRRYQDMAARRWLKRIEANLSITTEKSPLSEFVNRLVSEVSKRIDKALPPGEKPAPLPALAIIAEAVNNREKYAEAWETARKVIADKFEGQPDILEKLDEELMGVLDKPYSQKTLDRALKEALANLKTTVREVAKMHFKQADALGATLAERIAAESGLKPEQAEALAAEVSKRLAELTQEAKQKVLGKIGASKTGLARRMAGEVEKIIKLSNAGAFERAELMDLLAKELNLPKLTADHAKRLRDLAEKAQSTPEGFQRDRVETDILAELKKIEGVGKLDIATAVYYAHILSGYTTQMVNAVSTTLNTLADIGILVAQNPKTAGQALVGIRDGASLGFTHAMSILSGGYAPRYFDEKLAEASSTLEILSKGEAGTKGEKAIKAYSIALRYVGRSMKAADAVFFHSASEAFQRVAAAKLATAAGVMDRAELNRKVRDLLKMSPADFDAAMAQAKAEGLTGLDFQLRTAEISRQKRESGLEIDGTRFGREATFNNTPRGYLGLIAKSIGQASEKFPPLKLFVPFTNIVSNVTNASLNYTPLGAARAKFGYGLEGKPSAEERSTLLIKSIAGSMGMVALLALGMGDDDEKKRPLITANGPKDFAARRQLMETGWRPHSLRIGDTYVSYLVSPAALAAAMVGNWIDAVKYNGVAEKDMGERFAKAVGGVGETITNMSFLQGLADLMDTLRGKKSPSDFAAGVVVGATVPNLVRQVDRTLSPELRDGAGFVGRIQSQVPIVRQALPERQNVIAKPIESVPIERFGKQAKNDPLWDTIAKKQAWITEPSKTTKLGNETMTAEQYLRYVSESGPAIERRLRAALPSIDAMTDEKANDFVDKVAREERKKAKARMGNGRAFSALFDE